jgi:hypothetical protein
VRPAGISGGVQAVTAMKAAVRLVRMGRAIRMTNVGQATGAR